MTTTKACTGCNRELPVTRVYFGNTESGNFRGKCRQCMAAHTAAHKEANPSMAAKRRNLRKVRESNAGLKYSDQDIRFLREIQQDKCAYCMVLLNGLGDVDHMTPISKGGNNNFDNLALCCAKCNKEKHAKNLSEYLKWRLKVGLPVYENSYGYKMYLKN